MVASGVEGSYQAEKSLGNYSLMGLLRDVIMNQPIRSVRTTHSFELLGRTDMSGLNKCHRLIQRVQEKI